MYDINEAVELLQEKTAWQTTPYPMYEDSYVRIIIHSIKKFFVDINHPEEYDRNLYITDENGVLFYDRDFNILQEEYIFILSQIDFFEKVFSDLSGDGAVSYTTDALSVTGAKEGYKSVQQQLDTLEQERIRVFHKLMAHEEG